MIKIYKNFFINYIININIKKGKKTKIYKKFNNFLEKFKFKNKNILNTLESIIYFYLAPYIIITRFKKNVFYKMFLKVNLKKKFFKIAKKLFI